ncbi:hypothetical protein Tco_1414132 [Tanacetum coccineum]
MRGGWLIEGGGRRSGVTTSSHAMIFSSLSLLMGGKRIHDTIAAKIHSVYPGPSSMDFERRFDAILKGRVGFKEMLSEIGRFCYLI